MSEHRFRDLEEALRRQGVSVRHARRAALEMEGHYRQLLEDALARGESPWAAERDAHRALGTDRELIERFACRRELLSWSHRWPVGFVLAPLLSFVGLAVVDIAGLVFLVREAARLLHHTPIPEIAAADLNFMLGAFFGWVLPIAVAALFALLARRQRLALRWPVAAVFLLCAFSALLNVSCTLLPDWRGQATAGIGISLSSLPADLFWAGSKATLALIPLLWLQLRSMRDRLLV